jgi:ATP adenylyltransferase/5',5'''-P-1,P-4-tetraphosphate phosphorylase II
MAVPSASFIVQIGSKHGADATADAQGAYHIAKNLLERVADDTGIDGSQEQDYNRARTSEWRRVNE